MPRDTIDRALTVTLSKGQTPGPADPRAVRERELMGRIDAVPWHVSPGYVAPDQQQVGPHEYILVHEQPELFDAIYQAIREPWAWKDTYNGRRIRYRALGDYKYWVYRFVLNRERHPRLCSCDLLVTFLHEPTSKRVRRVSARTGQEYEAYLCGPTGHWHVRPAHAA